MIELDRGEHGHALFGQIGLFVDIDHAAVDEKKFHLFIGIKELTVGVDLIDPGERGLGHGFNLKLRIFFLNRGLDRRFARTGGDTDQAEECGGK